MRTLLAFLALAFAASPAEAQAPCHAENDTSTFADNVSMGGPNLLLAVQFSPTSSFNASRVEVFTGEKTGTNTVAIWSHDSGTGKPLVMLGQGSFAMSATNSWQGADLATPVGLASGSTYWMVWGCINSSQASIDLPQSFNGQVYRSSFDGGLTWNGPYQSTTSQWKFRVYGDCFSCPGFFQTYGSGCAGGLGVPQLDGQGCPSPGQSISIFVQGGPPSASGLLFLGAGNASAAITPGCLLQTLPLFPVSLPLTLSSSGATFLPASLPASLPTFDVYLQGVFADAAAPAGIAGTNALQMHVQ